jgi:LPS export ABC transporter protein LptC
LTKFKKIVKTERIKIRLLLSVLLCVLLVACRNTDVKHRAAAVADRKAMPVLEGIDVNTLISDSGITRYRIKAHKWLIFDKADTPYWEFPNGIYLERFDENLKPDATVEADYAFYNEPSQLWLLKGNVKAVNLEGEQFDSPLLYWDQKSESVYSDSSIVITRETSIIKGVGFRSNQSMTQYTILRPTGVFPIKD